jgi:phosphatidylserine decarboxylase
MESEARGPFEFVLVGALNVGRIRVVGVDPRRPAPTPALGFARGDELARFEMGSTVVLLWPRGVLAAVTDGVARGTAVRLGSPIARFA